MHITVIGAGNMGAAIAAGLCRAHAGVISVSNPSKGKLEKLSASLPEIRTFSDNIQAAKDADVVIIAVKPNKVKPVVAELAPYLAEGRQHLVSIAAGITSGEIRSWLGGRQIPVYYVIPNTAISIGESMTFISGSEVDEKGLRTVSDIFSCLGKVMVIDEKDIKACTALASCGIAYIMRYMRAAAEGAVQLGLRPADAMKILEQTVTGAAGLLRENGCHPEAEIDKVTTPGGLTIRGLNTMEEYGFSNAVIKGLLASV